LIQSLLHYFKIAYLEVQNSGCYQLNTDFTIQLVTSFFSNKNS